MRVRMVLVLFRMLFPIAIRSYLSFLIVPILYIHDILHVYRSLHRIHSDMASDSSFIAPSGPAITQQRRNENEFEAIFFFVRSHLTPFLSSCGPSIRFPIKYYRIGRPNCIFIHLTWNNKKQ